MNLTHVEGWYTEAHEQAGILLASFLAAPLALYRGNAQTAAISVHAAIAGCT
jgi:hypothetical protein